MHEEARYPIKSINKSVRIIELLKERKGAKLHEITEELDMTKSTVHNHLSTLRANEYVVKRGGEYGLSLRFLHIGGDLRRDIELYRIGKPRVEQLATDTDEHVTLANPELGCAIALYVAKGANAVEIDTHVGSQIGLHNSAIGKAILAHLPPNEVDEIVDRRGLTVETPNTITDEQALMSELETVRDRGFAVDDEETWRGLRCVAAPIVTDDGTVEGALSLSAPKNRLDTDGAETDYIEKVEHEVNVIELSMTNS